MDMELLAPRGAESKAKKPQSRLQMRAPASLQLDAGVDHICAWENDAAATASSSPSQAPIPLLSPLLISPQPVWENTRDHSDYSHNYIHQETSPKTDEIYDEDDTTKAVSSPWSPANDGWRHPALPVVMVEPASLAPLFQLQCGMVQNLHS